MSEEVDFDQLNNDDNAEDISTDNQNLKKKHEDFGANKETLELLDELIQNKDSFPEAIFLKIIEKVVESGEKEAKNKLYDFYCFLKKYGENIKSENLENAIELEYDKKSGIFSFWEKKLKHNIFDNLLESKKKELSDFFKNFSDELIEKGYEVKNIFNLICQLKEYKSEDDIKIIIIIESIINILKIYKIENVEFYEVIKTYIKNLNEDSPKEIYNIACKDKKKLDDLKQEELLEEIEKRNPKYFTEERKKILDRQMKIVYETYKKNEDFSSKEDIKKWKQDKHFIEMKRNYKQNNSRFEISA